MPLAKLEQGTLNGLLQQYGIHVLECASDDTDLLATVSLQPAETFGKDTEMTLTFRSVGKNRIPSFSARFFAASASLR